MLRRTRGFTLIEVVIATGLLLALCIGAASVLTLTLNTIDRSRQRAMALMLARAKLEQILSLTWSVRNVDGVLVLLDDPGNARSPPDSLVTSRAGYVDFPDGYQRRWAITRTGAGASELLIVQVMVTAGRGDRDAVWISGARLRRG
jgi:type II secretory pathway pseudopilin PulG